MSDLVERVALRMCELAYSHIPNLDIAEQADDPYWREQALTAIRIALEEAARVADDKTIGANSNDVFDAGWASACAEIAAAIRAMIKGNDVQQA